MNSKKDLDDVIESIDDFIIKNAKCWKHKALSAYNSKANVIDKNIRDRIRNTILRDLKPKNGVLSEKFNSAFRVTVPHKDSSTILHIDIENYYDNIKYEMMEKFLSAHFEDYELDFIKKFYFDESGGLRRGLFASVFIAEIVGSMIDNLVEKNIFQNQMKDKVVYTRYYDDLLFSGVTKESLMTIEKMLREELTAFGLPINHNKTKILMGNSIKILGLRIHNHEIMTTKRFRNAVRLRIHYADMMIDKLVAGDYDEYERALYSLGTVIGSLRFIIDNSTVNTQKYEILLAKYLIAFREVKSLEDELKPNEQPIMSMDMKSIEGVAIDRINTKKRPRRYTTQEEISIIDKIAKTIIDRKQS